MRARGLYPEQSGTARQTSDVFANNGSHPKIAKLILEESLEIFRFVICVEDYHKLRQTQFLIQSPLGNLDVCVVKNVTCLSSLLYSLIIS